MKTVLEVETFLKPCQMRTCEINLPAIFSAQGYFASLMWNDIARNEILFFTSSSKWISSDFIFPKQYLHKEKGERFLYSIEQK